MNCNQYKQLNTQNRLNRNPNSCYNDIPQDGIQIPDKYLFDNFAEIVDRLCEVKIRFDGCPSDYTKGDFEKLIKLIEKGFITAYNNDELIKNNLHHLVGIAQFNTNPAQIGIGHPGIYLANKAGVYTNFHPTLDLNSHIEVSLQDVHKSVVFLIPHVDDLLQTTYTKLVYHLYETLVPEVINLTASNDLFEFGHLFNTNDRVTWELKNPTFIKTLKVAAGTKTIDVAKNSTSINLSTLLGTFNPIPANTREQKLQIKVIGTDELDRPFTSDVIKIQFKYYSFYGTTNTNIRSLNKSFDNHFIVKPVLNDYYVYIQNIKKFTSANSIVGEELLSKFLFTRTVSVTLPNGAATNYNEYKFSTVLPLNTKIKINLDEPLEGQHNSFDDSFDESFD